MADDEPKVSSEDIKKAIRKVSEIPPKFSPSATDEWKKQAEQVVAEKNKTGAHRRIEVIEAKKTGNLNLAGQTTTGEYPVVPQEKPDKEEKQ